MGKNVAVFVDVANIFYEPRRPAWISTTSRCSERPPRDGFRPRVCLHRAGSRQREPAHFHQFLARHQYRVVSKDIRKYGDGKVKANLDIEPSSTSRETAITSTSP